jgi:hypothetical protein
MLKSMPEHYYLLNSRLIGLTDGLPHQKNKTNQAIGALPQNSIVRRATNWSVCYRPRK